MNNSITATAVPDDQRVQHTAKQFGDNFQIEFEPFVFSMADELEYYDCTVGSNLEMLRGRG